MWRNDEEKKMVKNWRKKRKKEKEKEKKKASQDILIPLAYIWITIDSLEFSHFQFSSYETFFLVFRLIEDLHICQTWQEEETLRYGQHRPKCICFLRGRCLLMRPVTIPYSHTQVFVPNCYFYSWLGLILFSTYLTLMKFKLLIWKIFVCFCLSKPFFVLLFSSTKSSLFGVRKTMG